MPELPEPIVETVRAMTRTVRRETHATPAAIRERRDELLDRFDYRARVRDEESIPVLVCYPAAWIEDGIFQPDQLDSTDAAVERPLVVDNSLEDWAGIEAHNQEVAEKVADRFGAVHGQTAVAFGTYMANHHETTVEAATAIHVEHFRRDYFPRNAWPTAEQLAVLDRSLELLFEAAGVADPPIDE